MSENLVKISASFNGKKAVDGITKLQKSFTSLRRIAMTVVGGAIIKEVSAFGREMNMMAERTGMSVAKLSSLRNAFISAGSGAKGFETTINGIASGLQGLMMGRGDFAAKLGMIGLSPYTAGGALKSEDQILYGIADWARSQRGRMTKQQILYQLNSLFGIDAQFGEKLLEGGAAFRKFQKEAAERMGEIDKETTDKLSNIKKSWDEFSGSIGNTSDKVIASLEKPLSTILDWSREIVKSAGDHPKITAAALGTVSLVSALGAIGGAITGAVSGIGALGGALLGLVGVLGTILELGIWGVLGAGVSYGVTSFINWIRSTPDLREKLQDYRIGETGFDWNKLEKDFWGGKINPSDEGQYFSALWALQQYNPEKYGKLWQDLLRGEGYKRAEMYGIPVNMPAEVEKATVSNTTSTTGDTTNDIDVRVEIVTDGSLIEEDYHEMGYEIGEKVADAISMKVPLQQSAT